MDDEWLQIQQELNMGEIEIDENGDWVWHSREDDDWDKFEHTYWQAYPMDIHPELRAKAELDDTDEVTDVNVFGPDGQRCVTLTLYDRERDVVHFEVVSCTRLERVRWGLEEDPYKSVSLLDRVLSYNRDLKEDLRRVEKKPTLADVDYDTGAYEAKLDEWYKAKAEYERQASERARAPDGSYTPLLAINAPDLGALQAVRRLQINPLTRIPLDVSESESDSLSGSESGSDEYQYDHGL